MSYDSNRALDLLRSGASLPDASFREGQEEAIRHIVEGEGRLLVVQKTGWGKSFVYFIATKLLREQGAGPGLLVSPLLALMRNQILAAERMGVRAKTINSDNEEEWEEIEAAVQRNEVDILLISPERLANQRFQERVLAAIAERVALLVIDEAHCISDWGHDFRPQYRLLEQIVATLPPTLRLLATTATANNRVLDDLRVILGPDLTISRGDLSRPSLSLQTIRLSGQAERLAWLAEQIPSLAGHGIVYTLTVRDAEQVAAWLRLQGLEVEAYTGRSGDERPGLEQALLENRVKALVATTALGMGFDKPDLGFVIHYQTPGSVVAYYQQVGRAGRALDSAYGILLSGEEDARITDFFIESAFPTPEEVRTVVEVLDGAAEGLSQTDLLARVNISSGRLDRTIKLLSLESPAPIVKQGNRWRLTASSLSTSFWDRADRLTALRKDEQAEMQRYVALKDGHMEFLIRALDSDVGRISRPLLPPLSTSANPGLVREAIEFLRRTSLPIEPRLRWPNGGMPRFGVSGQIDADLIAEPGRALSYWDDAGWGELTRQGKYHDRRFSDELVEACARLMSDWSPDPAPDWVTCIPSTRHPSLVPDFATRLAHVLGLPFAPVLEQVDQRPAQKTMANSVLTARNVDGAFSIDPSRVSRGPVLLVDDIVDSRWTLTVAAWLLRRHGSGKVWPLTLAKASGG